MSNKTNFQKFTLDNKDNLYVFPTDKFKTVHVTLFFHRNLGREATLNALFPNILERGCGKYPNMPSIAKFQESLFNADFGTDTLKYGDRQIVYFHLSLVNDRFLPGKKGNFNKGMDFLKKMVYEPLTKNKMFLPDYFEQEKTNQLNYLQSIINEKIQYANKRCIEEMCKGEAYGYSEDGNIEELKKIQNNEIFNHYSEFLRETPCDIIVLGQIEPEKIYSRFNRLFGVKKNHAITISPTLVDKKVEKLNVVIEEDDVEQGKLVMGLRTYTTYGDDGIFALIFFNNLLGGTPNARLFKQVREQNGMAYYVSSGIEHTKGIMKINAGINAENFSKAINLITEQKESILSGDISEEEWKVSSSIIINNLKTIGDSPSAIAHTYMEQLIHNKFYSEQDMIDRILSVSKDDVINAGKKIKLDTIYFLVPKGAKEKCYEKVAELHRSI